MYYLKLLCVATVIVGILLGGCEKRHTESFIVGGDESEYVAAILLDLSGSFMPMMADDGKAYNFALQVTDKYFRDRIGTNDKVIIAQISANDRSLLWQGTPLQLRQDFPSATEFRAFLHRSAVPDGSPVHHSMARVIDYVMAHPAVASGKAKSAVFVLSDMIDNDMREESSKQAKRSLTAYGQSGGIVGLYYVDQDFVAKWMTELQNDGFRDFRVECDIASRPDLPNFE